MSPVGVLFVAFLFGTGLVALLLAIGQVLIRNRNRGNRLLFFLYGAVAWTQLQPFVFALSGPGEWLPRLAPGTSLPLSLLGPLLLLFFRDVLLDRPLRRRWPHFLFPAVLAGGLLCGTAIDLWILSGWPQPVCAVCRLDVYLAAARLARLTANLQLLAYLVPLVISVGRSRPDLVSGRRVLRAVVAILLLSLLAVLSNLGVFVTDDERFDGYGSVILGLVVCAVFLLGYVYPEVLHVMRMEAYEARRSTSPLKSLDPAELTVRLNRLMSEERLYCDEDLQLATVARQLGIRPNQLTYFLNHVHEKNFASFVNEYRVREARTMLLEQQNRSVLQIGMSVGFNSKTAFYRAFDALTGMPPNEYRKKHRA